MTFFDLFWIFLILMAFQPLLRQKMLEVARQRLITSIQKERKSRVILLVHRQESMNFIGFPIMRYIDIHDSEEVIRAIQLTDDDIPIDIIVHTPGGLVLASLQIAMALNKHKGKVTVFVPHYAMSGGTLIALAADEIVMCDTSVLGPVDPQIDKYPAVSLLKTTKQKSLDKLEDNTLILADIGEKAIKQLEKSVYNLLIDNFDEEKSRAIAKKMTEGLWTHDYPITYEEAKELGLNVTNEMPKKILELMRLFPQPTKRVPSVEYAPLPIKRGNNTKN
ncbi:MAG: ATP-dependent Clp protease proteolytic subunit [Deferribacterota bacterium]|nr:ATP-dependent Clp protease proteolytic subunit [Deferribacterota bacterium]